MRVVNEKWKSLSVNIIRNDFDYFKLILEEYSYGSKKSCNLRFAYPQEYVNLLFITDFLPTKSTIRRRLWHIEQQTLSVPLCEHCTVNERKWLEGINNYKEKYCDDCYKSQGVLIKKIEASKIKKYGMNSAEIIADRNLKNHGVANIFSSKEFKDNQKQKMQEQYGVDHFVETEKFRTKYKETLLEAYGVDHYSKTTDFKEKFKNTCNIRYDSDHFNLDRFSTDTKNHLEDIDWLIDHHHVKKLTLGEMSELLENIDSTSIADRLRKYNIAIKNFPKSVAEKEIEEFLISKNINILTNTKQIITPYELDVYIPDHNLAIEYCGVYWHSELYKSNDYHKMKYDLCRAKGIKLITIFEDEWTDNQKLVKNKILYYLNNLSIKKVFARKCKITMLDTIKKSQFFNDNHIQGDGPSSINYGLFYESELVAAIGFIKNNDHYVLNRYATSYMVVGGFTKLLTYFEKQFNYPKIITFADLRWSEGDLYKNNGFVLDKKLKPDYSYIKNSKRFHKFNFRHFHMRNNFKNYDASISEHENCLNHKFYRIYDCGKLRFCKNY